MASRRKTTSDTTQVDNQIDNSVEKINEEKPIIPKDIDPNSVVTVTNGFHGHLVYISPRTHEKYEWSGFGDEQEMELRELRNAKSSAKYFFENNWFMFTNESAWVVPYLGLSRYYKNAIKIEDFDKVFDKTPEEIKEIISAMSAGQKASLSLRARQLVMDGEIDSRRVIATLEEALGTELIER